MNQFDWSPSFDFLETLSESSLALELADALVSSIIENSTIFLIGDGIFSGIGSTLAGDLSAKLAISGYKPKILSPYSNTTSFSTICSNLEFEYALSLFIRNNLSSKNLIIFLSDSGNSINLVRSSQMLVHFKDQYEISLWNISGYSGGALFNVCDKSLVLQDITTELLPSHIFYLMSKLLFKSFCSLSNHDSSPPPFPPLESNRSYTRINLNKIA